MNKLREKFENIEIELTDSVDGVFFGSLVKTDVDECEQITDDFSVKLIEWHSDLMFNFGEEHDGKSFKELQQYFKDNIYGKV